MAKNTIDIGTIKTLIADELGLTDNDLIHLYGVEPATLDKHIAALDSNPEAIYQRLLSDVDAVRVGYRQIVASDEVIAAFRKMLAPYPFHPLVGMTLASGGTGWRLSGDDAQYVAFRAADIVNMEFEWGETLRKRLNRLVIWNDATAPDTKSKKFRDHVADLTFYLLELSGVL